MKGQIQPNHIRDNNYSFSVLGLINLTAVEISGIEDTLQTVNLPDRTVASGGNREATEVTLKLPMHHAAEDAAMELWYRESQDPVSPTYKKPATLTYNAGAAGRSRSYTLVGVFPKKRILPEASMESEGEMAVVEWVLSIDDVEPI